MSCRDYELLLSLRATAALDAADAARVEGHLAGCPSCRAEADDLAAALGLAKLPPASEAERRVLRDLPERTLAAFRRSTRRRSFGKRFTVVAAAVAAAAAVVLAPAVLRKDVRAPAGEAVTTWEQPDLDGLWNDSSVLDLDASAALAEDEADATVAALDF